MRKHATRWKMGDMAGDMCPQPLDEETDQKNGWGWEKPAEHNKTAWRKRAKGVCEVTFLWHSLLGFIFGGGHG